MPASLPPPDPPLELPDPPLPLEPPDPPLPLELLELPPPELLPVPEPLPLEVLPPEPVPLLEVLPTPELAPLLDVLPVPELPEEGPPCDIPLELVLPLLPPPDDGSMVPDDDPLPPLFGGELVDEHAARTATIGKTPVVNADGALRDMVNRMVTLPRESQCRSRLSLPEVNGTKKPITELPQDY